MNTAGLYIHIPVCARRCRYCSFYSTTKDRLNAADYLASLLRQLDGMADELSDLPQVDSVYFGGGTPSLMPASFFRRFLDTVRDRLNLAPDPEVTVELNPEHGRPEYLEALAAAGINRLSIGLQSMSDAILERLGRIHDATRSRECLATACSVFRNVSIDLMIGIAGAPSIAEELAQIPMLDHVHHVSVYMLEGERAEGLADDPDQTADHYLRTVATLEEAGLNQYEISNFARPGYASHHNSHYWAGDPYVGLGPSAHSFLPPVRLAVQPDLATYLAGRITVEGTRYETDVLVREMVMLGLRRVSGISRKHFQDRYGVDVLQSFRFLSDRFPGLVIADEAGIRLTLNGFLLSNEVFQDLIG